MATHRGGRGPGGDRRSRAREIHQRRCDARRARALNGDGLRAALRPRAALRLLLALAYTYAGYRHLATPSPFLAMMPPWVPQPDLVVAATGIPVIAGAIGLIERKSVG